VAEILQSDVASSLTRPSDRAVFPVRDCLIAIQRRPELQRPVSAVFLEVLYSTKKEPATTRPDDCSVNRDLVDLAMEHGPDVMAAPFSTLMNHAMQSWKPDDPPLGIAIYRRGVALSPACAGLHVCQPHPLRKHPHGAGVHDPRTVSCDGGRDRCAGGARRKGCAPRGGDQPVIPSSCGWALPSLSVGRSGRPLCE